MLRRLAPSTKIALRKFVRRIGFDVRLNGINSREDLRFVHFLNMHRIEVVLDVGANRGQFASGLFEAGFQGRVISFEPLPEANRVLKEVAAPFGDRWEVHRPVALSDASGTAEFFVTTGDTSSSLLEPMQGFVENTPVAQVSDKIQVATERLDNLYPDLALGGARTFLKLDVQGGEDKVLAGGVNSLDALRGALIELSFATMYDNQTSALDLQQEMASRGFSIWDIWPGYSNPVTHRLNQVDALFFKDEPEEAA